MSGGTNQFRNRDGVLVSEGPREEATIRTEGMMVCPRCQGKLRLGYSEPECLQCGFADYNANTVTVTHDTLEEALQLAIETAGQDDAWKRLDHCGDTYVDAIAEVEDGDSPWDNSLEIPRKFTEAGLWHVKDDILAAVEKMVREFERYENSQATLNNTPEAQIPAMAQARAAIAKATS